MNTFMAHSAAGVGKWHSLKDHLVAVAELAAEFASVFGAREEAHLAGLLHDLGKYGDLFQQRLYNPRITGVDHWTMGAWAAYSRYKKSAVAACLAAAGHHLGLLPLDKDTLPGLNPDKYNEDKRRLSEKDITLLLERQRADGIELPSADDFSGEITGPGLTEPAAAMLDYRMLFSVLVDADFLDTEAHFNRGPDGVKRLRAAGPGIDAAWALETLLAHIRELAAKSESSEPVNLLRADLLDACLAAAESKPGLFTLSAPTGAGKTLAMLAFALKHAAEHGLRRVVMVIPHLTIIEQTAAEYNKVFAGHLLPDVAVEHYILEHHSMAGLRGPEGGDAEDQAERRRRELTQNWDAPIIVTTSVQMLESLFSHRPGACRKLHRLANSVILFDEVQTLPTHLAAATLAALARLCNRFGASVVFSTATQPAFEALSDKARSLGGEPWTPREIARPELGLFKRVERVKVAWPQPGEALSLDEVAAALAKEKNRRSLCVVNLKRQARGMLQELQALGAEGLFHLSTSMCPAHREAVLRRVRNLLRDPAQPPVRLVSTQCVEAGVDLDFPVVWRAWGPLTSIAQAAGRCNRNGNLEVGRVRVFRLWEKDDQTGRTLRPYPDEAYKQAAQAADVVLAQCGPKGADIDDPELFRAFYCQLYRQAGTADQFNDLENAVRQRHFENTAKLYRLIDNDAINILVPYDHAAYDALAQQAREEGLNRAWMAKARPHTVGLFRPREDSPLSVTLEPIPILGRGARGRDEMSRDWFICPAEDMYDPVMGLTPPEHLVFWDV